MIKSSIFWTKPCTNPPKKFPLVKVFKNVLFLVQKVFFFIQNLKTKRFFVAWLLQKTKIIKTSIFWQKQWTNLFEESWFFGLFYPEYKTSFSSSKKHFFYSEHQKRIFFCLICQKNVHDRMFDFFFYENHGLTPLKNFHCLDF